MTTDGLLKGEDGKLRCWWQGNDALYQKYHDEEWGRPTSDDRYLFEKLCLEGFQAGLSWITILRRRENFRRAFANFDHRKVAKFTQKDVERLLRDEGIIRHRGKIEATINNAQKTAEVIAEFGSLAAYLWQFEPGRHCEEGKARRGNPEIQKTGLLRSARNDRKDIPAVTEESKALSKDLKKRGFKFVGATTMYAMMQAVGMVNDHLTECCLYKTCEDAKKRFKRS